MDICNLYKIKYCFTAQNIYINYFKEELIMKNISWKKHIIKSLKIAIAALLAIFVAGELGLKNSATAGIITVLSIQNTKRETLKRARNRVLAYICALIISKICFTFLGYNLLAFGLYLLIFAMICLILGWNEAISTDSVLVTHFLAEGNMSYEFVINESLILIIGISFGVIVNLHLRKKQEKFDMLAKQVDVQMKMIIHEMSRWLLMEDKSKCDDTCFEELTESIEFARKCAAANYNNSLFSDSTFELDYIEMRAQQSVVLREIYYNIIRIQYLPERSKGVSDLLLQIEQGFHRNNTVVGLLDKAELFLQNVRKQPLPQTREEFEVRALLYYVLLQIKQLLEIKLDFIKMHKASF